MRPVRNKQQEYSGPSESQNNRYSGHGGRKRQTQLYQYDHSIEVIIQTKSNIIFHIQTKSSVYQFFLSASQIIKFHTKIDIQVKRRMPSVNILQARIIAFRKNCCHERHFVQCQLTICILAIQLPNTLASTFGQFN